MQDNRWIGDVLEDLSSYCDRNGLAITTELVSHARSVLEGELKALGLSVRHEALPCMRFDPRAPQ